MNAIRTADLLHPVLLRLADVASGITEDQLNRPTPCTDYDVAALRGHVLQWLSTFAAGFADPDGRAPAAGSDGSPAAGPAERVWSAADQLDAAVRNGAAERPLYLGENSMPGELALSMILWEYLVHGWDLARATGQNWEPDEAAIDAALEFAPGMLTADYQGAGKAFADRVPVPPEAAPMERLVGLSGRNPGWSAPVR